MSKRHPDNPIVGILAKTIKQEWLQKSSEQNNTQEEISELTCRILISEERIEELERKVAFLMEFCLQFTETPTRGDNKGKRKIKLPYPTTYISNQQIKNDTDKEYEYSNTDNDDIQSDTNDTPVKTELE